MKKLLYTLLAVSLIFSACKKEEETPTNNTNSNNSALAIGDSHQGGIIFYLDGNGGGLIAASTDQSEPAQWGCYGTVVSGADGTAIGTGAQNTIDIVNADCTTTDSTYLTAANICSNLTLGGYTDWFLPSKDELNEMYLNAMYLNIGQGPPLGNLGATDLIIYWSSSEDTLNNGYNAYGQNFVDGNVWINDKVAYYVRAVRAF